MNRSATLFLLLFSLVGATAPTLAAHSLAAQTSTAAAAAQIAPLSATDPEPTSQSRPTERVGLVLDAETGEPLLGAAVLISGTTTGTTTDWDGIFRLSVAQGNQLEISYIGYQSKQMQVNAGQDTLRILLSSDTEVLQEVAVTSKRRRNTDMSVLQSTKNALSVQTGISSEQIQRSQDRDASEVIRRVPGISLIDDKFVMVRGLSQRYNQVWINGAAVPSSEADSRAFSFDLLPSSQLDNLLIIKSPAPEYPADYSGGMVLVQTKDVPEYKSWSVQLGGAINDQAHFRSFYRSKSSPTDWLGFDSGMRGLPNGIHSTLTGYSGVDNSVSLTANSFNNDWTVKKITPVSDLSLGFNGSESWTLPNGQSLSMLLSGNYSRSYKHYRDMLNCLYGAYDEAQHRSSYLRQSTDDQQTIHTRLGVMFNLSYARRAGKDRIELKNIFNQLGRERYTTRVGISAQNDAEEQAEYNYQSRTTYSGQLTGRHLFLDDDIEFRWNGGYAYSNRNQPDRRRYMRNDALEDGVLQLSSSNDISREYTYLYEHIGSLSLDYSETFHWGWFEPQLKAGFYGEYRSRSYSARTFYYNWNQASNTLPTGFRQWDIPTELMQEDNYGVDRLFLLEQVQWRNNYDGRNTLLAGYVGFNMPFGPVNLYTGVRYEYNDMELIRNTRDREYSPRSSHYRTSDFFPSANLTYRINERHYLRASYGMSINRPEFREVSPSVYYDFDLASNVQGNIDLQSCRIQNCDLRYEYYPKGGKGEIVSVALFYKHFRHPIEWTYTVTGGTDLTYSYQNADRAYSYGAELDIRKDLSFMGMRGFQFTFNGALIQSRVQFPEGSRESARPMQGQSPYLINTGLFYAHERTGWSCSVLYNRIGKRLIGVGRSVGLSGSDDAVTIPDSYEMPRNMLDLNLSKSFGEHWTIRFSARDVIGEKIVYQQIATTTLSDGTTEKVKQITRSYRPGRTFTLSVTWKL